MRNDVRCGFETVKARDLDRLGVERIIKKLKERVGDTKVYVSVDIDVLDVRHLTYPILRKRD